jgi:hypothetical protein
VWIGPLPRSRGIIAALLALAISLATGNQAAAKGQSVGLLRRFVVVGRMISANFDLPSTSRHVDSYLIPRRPGQPQWGSRWYPLHERIVIRDSGMVHFRTRVPDIHGGPYWFVICPARGPCEALVSEEITVAREPEHIALWRAAVTLSTEIDEFKTHLQGQPTTLRPAERSIQAELIRIQKQMGALRKRRVFTKRPTPPAVPLWAIGAGVTVLSAAFLLGRRMPRADRQRGTERTGASATSAGPHPQHRPGPLTPPRTRAR